MTDYPRFDRVKGDADAAHEAYHGGGLVSFVFRLVDRRKGTRSRQAASAIHMARGGIEVHERAPAGTPTEFLPGTAEAMTPVQRLYRLAPDEVYPREFLIGSATTMKAQRGLLAAFVAVLVILVVQGWNLFEQPRSQAARNTVTTLVDPMAKHRPDAPMP